MKYGSTNKNGATITQAGKIVTPTMRLSKTELRFDYNASNLPIEITASKNWNASNGNDWVTLDQT